MSDRFFTDLTKAQVEALLQCFDFLDNGYHEQSCFEVDDVWIIQMQHSRTLRVIRVFIRPDRYRIVVRGRTKKKVLFASSQYRYRILVNSDGTRKVHRMCPGRS